MMRKILVLAGLGYFLLGGLAHAADQTARELFDALPAQIRAEAEAKRTGKLPQGVGQPDANFLLSILRSAREAADSGDENNAVLQLRQLENLAGTDPVRDDCEAAIVRLHKEHVDNEAAANAEAASMLRRAGEAIVAAKSPADLDSTLRELASIGEARESGHLVQHGTDLFTRRLQNAAKFTARWQDYLISVNRNENRQAGETLRSLLSDNNEAIQALGLPRSQIITRLPSASQNSVDAGEAIGTALNAILDRTKTLDDLPAAIHDVQSLRDSHPGSLSGSFNNDLGSALEALQTYHKTRLEFQAGLRTNLELMSTRYDINSRIPGGIESYFVPLRAQLVALELPRLLNAPDEKPAPGETLDRFWRRLLDAAKKRGDWVTVAQGLAVGRALIFSADPGSAEMNNSNLDTTGFKSLLAAFNFEAAGQYSQAVAAYLAALGSTVPDLPVTLIGEHLAVIKKNHLKEYEVGTHAGSSTEDMMARYLDRYSRRSSDDGVAAATPSSTPTPTPSVTPAAVPKSSP